MDFHDTFIIAFIESMIVYTRMEADYEESPKEGLVGVESALVIHQIVEMRVLTLVGDFPRTCSIKK